MPRRDEPVPMHGPTPAFPHAAGVPGVAPDARRAPVAAAERRQRLVEELLEAAIQAQQAQMLLEVARRNAERAPTRRRREGLDAASRRALDRELRFERLWREAERLGLVDPLGRGGSPAR